MKTIQQILGRKPIHPLPARMAPSIAFEAIKGTNERLRVLDPMAGSGTVLAVARACGHKAIGIDADPLAVLQAKVWTTAADRDAVRSKAAEVSGRAKQHFSALRSADAYPSKADEETRSCHSGTHRRSTGDSVAFARTLCNEAGLSHPKNVVAVCGSPHYWKLTRDGYRMLYGQDCVLPKRRYFEEIAIGHHAHTFALGEFLTHLYVSAHQSRISVERFSLSV